MKATELTPHHRIMILEDVLRKLESGDTAGGLCVKITASAFKLFRVWEFDAKNIIPLFTFENAKKVTDVAYEASYWYPFENYDFENRIKFVNWMIEMERSLLNK